MQEKWDDIDNLILNSFDKRKLSSDYNEKLMSKIQKNRKRTVDIPAMSLIVSGLAMIMMINTNIQYKMIKAQYIFKTEVMVAQYKYKENMDIIKLLIGDEYNAKKK